MMISKSPFVEKRIPREGLGARDLTGPTDGPDRRTRPVLDQYFDHEFDQETYLELKISIITFDWHNITSVTLQGRSVMAEQFP